MNLPDAGISRGGHERAEGIATETFGREDDPEIYQKEIDERITKIRPMATPIDQISRYATVQRSGSFEVKYYSVGTRPVKTTLTTAVTASSTPSVEIEVADPDMFTLDDTIRVVGVKAKTDYKGVAYNANAANTPDLVLCQEGRPYSPPCFHRLRRCQRATGTNDRPFTHCNAHTRRPSQCC